jgi:hypothetical protein
MESHTEEFSVYASWPKVRQPAFHWTEHTGACKRSLWKIV